MQHNSCNKGTLSFGKALAENSQASNARRNKKWSTQKWALFWPLIFQSTYAASSTPLICVRQVTQAKSMHMVCARCGVRDSGDVSIIPSSNIGIFFFFLFSCLFYLVFLHFAAKQQSLFWLKYEIPSSLPTNSLFLRECFVLIVASSCIYFLDQHLYCGE